jgi:hypothetical protein
LQTNFNRRPLLCVLLALPLLLFLFALILYVQSLADELGALDSSVAPPAAAAAAEPVVRFD